MNRRTAALTPAIVLWRDPVPRSGALWSERLIWRRLMLDALL